MGLRQVFAAAGSISALCFCLAGTVQAAETEIAGTHTYTTQEDSASDDWYAIARGTYLSSGTATVSRDGTAKMATSATTNATMWCDTVKAGAYLDESSDGGSSFYTIASYLAQSNNDIICHVSKGSISATSGWYYQTRGIHSVVQGSTVETSITKTGAIKAS